MNLNQIINKKKKLIDIARIPEFLLVLINLFLAAVICLLALTLPRGVPLPSLQIGQVDFHFYVVAIFAFMLQVVFASLVMLYRLFVRK